MCFKIFTNTALEIFYCTLRGTLHDLRRNNFNQNFSLFTLKTPRSAFKTCLNLSGGGGRWESDTHSLPTAPQNRFGQVQRTNVTVTNQVCSMKTRITTWVWSHFSSTFIERAENDTPQHRTSDQLLKSNTHLHIRLPAVSLQFHNEKINCCGAFFFFETTKICFRSSDV